MEVETYDILDAGPNNRFMAEGRIVSNSGRRFQAQNLPSRDLPPALEVAQYIYALKLGIHEELFA